MPFYFLFLEIFFIIVFYQNISLWQTEYNSENNMKLILLWSTIREGRDVVFGFSFLIFGGFHSV